MFSDENKKRFRAKVKADPGGCWLWDGAKDHRGYGRFYLPRKGKSIPAHHYLFELINGKIPKGLELHHKCRQRNCVNPGHLEVVTHAENMKRAKERGAWAGSKNSRSKFVEGEVVALRLLYSLCIPASWLAKVTGIKKRTLFYLLREGWTHVATPSLKELNAAWNHKLLTFEGR